MRVKDSYKNTKENNRPLLENILDIGSNFGYRIIYPDTEYLVIGGKNSLDYSRLTVLGQLIFQKHQFIKYKNCLHPEVKKELEKQKNINVLEYKGRLYFLNEDRAKVTKAIEILQRKYSRSEEKLKKKKERKKKHREEKRKKEQKAERLSLDLDESIIEEIKKAREEFHKEEERKKEKEDKKREYEERLDYANSSESNYINNNNNDNNNNNSSSTEQRIKPISPAETNYKIKEETEDKPKYEKPKTKETQKPATEKTEAKNLENAITTEPKIKKDENPNNSLEEYKTEDSKYRDEEEKEDLDKETDNEPTLEEITRLESSLRKKGNQLSIREEEFEDIEIKTDSYEGSSDEDSSTISLIREYLKDIPKQIVPEDELKILYSRMNKGDESAKQEIVKRNLALVLKTAKKYMNKGLDFIDLIQEGNMSLIKAVEKFDYSKGYKFSTYAVWWIKQGMVRALCDKARTIRIPVHETEFIIKVKKMIANEITETGKELSVEEIAEIMNVPAKKVQNALRQSRTMSIEEEAGGRRIADQVSGNDETSYKAEESVKNEMIVGLLDRIKNEREREIIERRFGLNGKKPQTLEELGTHFGLTRERIRQIEAKTLKTLRKGEHSREVKEFYME